MVAYFLRNKDFFSLQKRLFLIRTVSYERGIDTPVAHQVWGFWKRSVEPDQDVDFFIFEKADGKGEPFKNRKSYKSEPCSVEIHTEHVRFYQSLSPHRNRRENSLTFWKL